MSTFRFRGQQDLAQISQALRRVHGNARRELTQSLRAAADPAVQDLRRAVRGADVSGRRAGGGRPFRARVPSRGLRGPIARAVRADVSTSASGARVVIEVREGAVPPRARQLIKYVVGDAKRWRHPIMGRRSRWASQNAPNVGWKTLRPHLPRFNRAVQSAVTRTEQQLTQET